MSEYLTIMSYLINAYPFNLFISINKDTSNTKQNTTKLIHSKSKNHIIYLKKLPVIITTALISAKNKRIRKHRRERN